MELKIEYMEPDRLRPYEGNARTHSDNQVRAIAESVRQFGFTNPILADAEGIVIAGHGRLEAAKKLGLTAVPVVRLSHLSERQRLALTLADNKIALNAGWDFGKLSEELSILAELDFDLSITGFDEQELDALLKQDADILPASWSLGATTTDQQQQQTGPVASAEQGSGGAIATGPVQPTEFTEYSENIGYEYCCPKCKFVWSGKPK